MNRDINQKGIYCLLFSQRSRVYMQGVYSRDMTRLVGEVEDLRQMMESMKRIVTGLGLEEKGVETGDRVAKLGEAEKKCEGEMTPDNN